jgi:tetratricopeptide (TPR) repeat protein
MEVSGGGNKPKNNGMSAGGEAGVGAPGGPSQIGVQLSGGAAIVAPVSAFPNGVPGNALVVLPLTQVNDEMKSLLEKGPLVITPEKMWTLLGFNGPPVQVQDDQGRPIAIGLEDLLSALEKAWQEDPDDANRGRVLAQELLKHSKHERAEKVLAKLVGSGSAVGDDWLAWGVTQLQLGKLDKAEGTLKGAQNLMPTNPYPSLHLARIAQQREHTDDEREMVRRAISIDRRCVDAWAFYFESVRNREGDDQAVATIEREAGTPADEKNAAPYIAMQGFYAASDDTRAKAIDFAKKAVSRNSEDPLALLVLSALYGQKGELDQVISLLQPHEPKMMRDVRLAHNYFEALFQAKQFDKVTKLLNALAASPDRQVKQFAIERSKAVAQFFQQQQQQLMSNVRPAGSSSPAPPSGPSRNN